MAGVSNQTVEHDAKTRGIILHIVEQIKSQGVFDRFRRDCLEELDGKEPYRQLKQRVESHVATFLSKQTFSANLPKNQLRTSLRANINQSEVLSKGVDRLLEQVLVEKSNSFYKEIENLVEEHLISTGHYTRYDKSQRSDAQPRSELTKLSDKEVEDIIKQETDRLLEASTDEKSKESDRSFMADTPPPGTSGEVIEVETLINIATDESYVETPQHLGTNVEAVNLPETGELKSAVSTDKTSVDKPESEDPILKEKTQESQQNDELKFSNTLNAEGLEIVQTGTNKGQEMAAPVGKLEISISESSNETGQMSAPEIVAEPYQVKSSVSVDDNPCQAMDVDTEPLSSDKNTYELPGQICENKLETKKPEESAIKAAVKICQSAEKHEVSKENTTVALDLKAVAPGSKLEESKGDINELNVTVKSTQNPTAEIKTAKISEAKVDNQELLKPKVEHDVAKSGEMKLEIVKTEKAGVAKPKVDKKESAEVDKPEVVKPELNKPEVSKSKVKLQEEVKADKLQSKLSSKTVAKATATKPISTLNIFSTDEETDEDLVIPKAKLAANQREKRKPEFIAADIAELSDSDITVSSVHTSDLSSLEDSDMEYEDYQELVLKKSKGKQSGTNSSDKGTQSVRRANDEAGADKKNDGESYNDETKSGESSADTKGNVDMVSEKFDTEEKESDGTGAAEQSKEYKSGATISKGIDDESGEIFSSEERKIYLSVAAVSKNEDCEVTESDASTGEVKDEKNVDNESTTALSFAHDSAAVSLQTTELNSSETAGSTSLAHMEKEQASPKDEKPTCSQETTVQISEAALFKPIDPEEPNILETASSQDSKTAHVQPTGDTSDDNETTMEDSDVANIKFGKRRHSHRISTEQESESSNDATIPTEEQKEALSQRRSARVASKEKTKPDEKDDRSQANVHKAEDAGDSARQLRRTRYSQDKTDELKAPKSKEERRNERAEKRVSRAGSDSTDSDVKPSKRSKRTVRPTRCYSPSENS